MKKTISIIGGGAAAITLAAFLNKQKFEVTIFEKNKALGRKFLVAGKGGFNLTHSEQIESFIERYTPSSFLKEVLLKFTNNDLRDWLYSIGIPTYVGSSKRVYPKEGIKPILVLKAIQTVLKENGVKIDYNKIWTGWDISNNLVFNNKEQVKSDYTIFALGGGSWKVTGSDGNWLPIFEKKGVNTIPFQASNCAYNIEWENDFILKHAGAPLKNISITCLNKKQKGEVVITQFGLEGNAIYALSPEIRSELKKQQKAIIFIDLKPTLSYEAILIKLKKSNSKKITELLKRELKLSSVQIGLLKTCISKEDFLTINTLAQKIKSLPFNIINSAELDESISTVGGICLSEIDLNYQLNTIKNNYCIGEMLDWDAPTGGYLLQACFSMGFGLAQHLNAK
ncbi:MAG: aminoacetone oxidase family FAD-binding enzyme [Flavobacteriales bacterium]|nr:MAG: aminoacetone oxidase family FAD-binding enzyme [Flavobacteriales bacterium]